MNESINHKMNENNIKNINPNEMQMINYNKRYKNYKKNIKNYYIHDDMFLNLDQIIIELLCNIFPKQIAITINDYNNSYFTDNYINESIKIDNNIRLFWNDFYFELNKLNLPVHDQDWCFWQNHDIILRPFADEYGMYCIPCNDMFWISFNLYKHTHNVNYNAERQELYYYSYNDNGIKHY